MSSMGFLSFSGFNEGEKPWIAVNDNYVELNLANQTANTTETSHYKNYRKLIMLRKTMTPLRSGTLHVAVSSDEKALTVARTADEETVLLVINYSDNETVTVNVASQISSLESKATVQVTTLGTSTKAGY